MRWILRGMAVLLFTQRSPSSLFMVVLMLLFGSVESQMQSMTNNMCQVEMETGEIVYSPCIGDPLHLLIDTEFEAVLDPPDATCGDPSEAFCTLGLTDCYHCNQALPEESHPFELLYDSDPDNLETPDTSTWWQSTTWAGIYPDPLNISITFNFSKLYELHDTIVITFKNSRPRMMIIERTIDFGETWEVWQYYASDCLPFVLQGLAGTQVTPSNPTRVICTEEQSSNTPYENGQVTFSVTEDRFSLFLGQAMSNYERLYSAFDNTQLDEFLQFTGIRILLLQPATDGLEYLNKYDDLIKYYYAIEDIDIIANCFCNLHGKYCQMDETAGVVTCLCEHNTMGVNCESCLPLYNNRPWAAGTYTGAPGQDGGVANDCQKCTCYDHADSCVYDLMLKTGVCQECYHNTMGTHCEICIDAYYRNQSAPLDDPNVCIPCECEMLGVAENNSRCFFPSSVPPRPDGCLCKEKVTGFRCDVCVDNYYGLLLNDTVYPPGECIPCHCELDGTEDASNICEPHEGQCPCKPHTDGRRCDICKDGYYRFPVNLPEQDCIDCECNLGGAASHACDKVSGKCECNEGIRGQHCDQAQEGYYVPALDVYSHQPLMGSCTAETDIPSPENPFTGLYYYHCMMDQQVIFSSINGDGMTHAKLSWDYFPMLRYSTIGSAPVGPVRGEITVMGDSYADLSWYTEQSTDGEVISTTCPQIAGSPTIITIDSLPPGVGLAWMSPDSMVVDVRCMYAANIILDGPGELIVDSLTIIPDYTKSAAYIAANDSLSTLAAYEDCIEKMTALSTASEYSSLCYDFIFAIEAELHSGALPCDCDPVGTVAGQQGLCMSLGGQCPCKHGVFGRRCDMCEPGYYDFTSTGCKACNCWDQGSEYPVCDYVTGQCPCKTNVASYGTENTLGMTEDLQCRACLVDYGGYYIEEGCQACLCNEEGILNNATQCDDNGQCTCKPTIGGSKCDICEKGYYGFTPDGCTPCDCNEYGSLGIECDPTLGQCTCKDNVGGMKCDVCLQGNFNLQSINPDGCSPCFCYGHGEACVSTPGYYQRTITGSPSIWEINDDPDLPRYSGVVKEYLSAPGNFLGNRVSSYAQYLTVWMQPTNTYDMDMSICWPVILEGADRSLWYNASGVNMGLGGNEMWPILLHEDFWLEDEITLTDAYTLQTVLEDLRGLYVMRKYSSVVFDVSKVNLVTTISADEGQGDGIVSGAVEECTCLVEHRVNGSFCEICANGYWRQTWNGSPYQVCQLCDCSDRQPVDQVICDENTGLCLNCPDGTIGDHCESCADYVIEPDCIECFDNYWGISQIGCSPCDCDSTGSLHSSGSPVPCEKVSGQCVCVSNTVTGRRCDECIDNYEGLSDIGCTECPECYGLVYEKVVELRILRDNLTTYVTSLYASEASLDIGTFAYRLKKMHDDMVTLLDYLESAESMESSIRDVVDTLNNTMHRMREIQEMDISVSVDTAWRSVEDAAGFIQVAQTIESGINATVWQADDLLTSGVSNTISDIGVLVEQLADLEEVMVLASGGSEGEVTDLLDVVTSIESTSRVAFDTAEEALRTAEAAQTEYSLTTLEVGQLDDDVTAMMTSANDLREQASYLKNNASSALSSIIATGNRAVNMPTINVNVDLLLERGQALSVDAAEIQDIANVATAGASNVLVALEESRVITENVTSYSDALSARCDILMTRIHDAYDVAMTAAISEDNTFQGAVTMLDVMTNFGDRVEEVRKDAERALLNVDLIQSSALGDITTAQGITQSLLGAKTRAEASLAIAQAAYNQTLHLEHTFAADNGTTMDDVVTTATLLEAQAAPVLSNTQAAVEDLMVAEGSQVVPASTTCNNLDITLTSLEDKVERAEEAANDVQSSVAGTQKRIANVMASFGNLGTLDNEKIALLRAEVDALRDSFAQSEIATAVGDLSAAVSQQRAWIQSKQAQRDILRARLERLQKIKSELRTTN